MLSKRAQMALTVLRAEAEGNRDASSALASLERAMGGAQSGQSEQDTPGRRAAQSAMKRDESEAKDNASEERSENFPPKRGGEAPSREQSTKTDGATARSSLPELMRRRKGTARKGKQ